MSYREAIYILGSLQLVVAECTTFELSNIQCNMAMSVIFQLTLYCLFDVIVVATLLVEARKMGHRFYVCCG